MKKSGTEKTFPMLMAADQSKKVRKISGGSRRREQMHRRGKALVRLREGMLCSHVLVGEDSSCLRAYSDLAGRGKTMAAQDARCERAQRELLKLPAVAVQMLALTSSNFLIGGRGGKEVQSDKGRDHSQAREGLLQQPSLSKGFPNVFAVSDRSSLVRYGTQEEWCRSSSWERGERCNSNSSLLLVP